MDAKGQPLAEGTLGGKVHEVVDENNDRFVIKVQKPAAKKIDVSINTKPFALVVFAYFSCEGTNQRQSVYFLHRLPKKLTS